MAEVPILYLFIYSELKSKFNCRAVESSVIFSEMSRRVSKIPKVLFWNVICEMERYELLKKANRNSIIILPNKQIKKLDQLKSTVLW